MESLVFVLFILVGVFSVLASVKNWNWFFNNRKARPFVHIFGRTGARIFYTLIGIFIMGVGIVYLIKNRFQCGYFRLIYTKICGGEYTMAVKIRLRRMGAKKAPFYRIVVADSRYPRDGRFVEEIGYYDPTKNPSVVKVDADKAKDWIKKGAQPTDTVKVILKKEGVL